MCCVTRPRGIKYETFVFVKSAEFLNEFANENRVFSFLFEFLSMVKAVRDYMLILTAFSYFD